MRFPRPLYADVSIEPPVYSNGVLQKNFPPLLKSMGYQFTQNLVMRQCEIFERLVNNPEIQQFSNDDLQRCISEVSRGMGSSFGIYHIAFRNTDDGCEPFILSVPYGQSLTSPQQKAIMAAAVFAAKLGVVVEFCPDVASHHPEMQSIYEGCRQLGCLVAAPHYEYSEEKDRCELHGVLVGVREDDDVPFTDHAWSRLASYVIVGLHPFLAARKLGKTPHYDPQPVSPREGHLKWNDYIRVLSRENFTEVIEKIVGTDDPIGWHHTLLTAGDNLGFADPHSLHPKRLYTKLKNTHDISAMGLAETTQKTATELTTSVISQTWLDTLHAVLGGVTSVIPDAEKVFFATHIDGIRCDIQHNLSVPLSADEELAIGLVALWTATLGEAIFDTRTDNQFLFNHLRKLARCDLPIVAIPVYSWEVGQKGTPSLHGVFVALRHPNAPQPSYSTQLAWTLAAQYLLSPLAEAANRDGLYFPRNVEDSHRLAYARPAFPELDHVNYLLPLD